MKIITRFAPSPTGNMHIGNLRTALYSWLFARKKNGKFILRIEDTDLKRLNKYSIKSIIKSLKWLNLNWDEGPFFQSDRFKRYNEIIDLFLKKGIAYKCYCTKKRLYKLKIKQIKKKKKPLYDGYCIKNINFIKKKKTFCNTF